MKKATGFAEGNEGRLFGRASETSLQSGEVVQVAIGVGVGIAWP